MSSCKDCIHYEACKDWINETALQKYVEDNGCDKFKDKSRIVELPCKVGDKVYAIFEDSFIKAVKVVDIQITEDDVLFFTPEYGKDKKPTSYDLGQRFNDGIYLTREEAERALKELKNNET